MTEKKSMSLKYAYFKNIYKCRMTAIEQIHYNYGTNGG